MYMIEQDQRRSESWEYRYRILKDGKLVARYWHDHRGDDHGIEFLNGESEQWPVGRMVEFLTGGGPEPLRLTQSAVVYLDHKLG